MALAPCPDCGTAISLEALQCPHCGRPNKPGINKQKDGQQKIGCAIMLAALAISLFSIPAASIVFLVGLVLMLVNTRFS